MFFRTYPDVVAIIGGYISIIFTFAGIAYFVLVRYIDNIRIFDSIKDEDKKELSNLINKEDKENNVLEKYDNEICCCCCECCICYDCCNSNEVKIEDSSLIKTDYNVKISCEEKWHYYFYKLTRNCCKQKDNSNKGCCEKTIDCFVLIFDALLSVIVFCGGCDTDTCSKCLGCDKNKKENDNDNEYTCCEIICMILKGTCCCCMSDDANNKKLKKLRRIDEYLEQYSDAENYLELIINKENKKDKKIMQMDNIGDYSNY